MMRKLWICSIRVRGCLVLAAAWGILTFPGATVANPPPHSHGDETDADGGFKDIPVCIELFDAFTVPADPDALVQSDNGPYCDSKKNKILAHVGRDSRILLGVNESSGRTLFLDLIEQQCCACSTQIDVEPIDNVCDDPTPCFDDVPVVPNLMGNIRFRINMGEELDDLPIGCTHDDNATLTFTDGVDSWVLGWGPYDTAGGAGHCPGSGHITVTRMDDNTWYFTTTGDHLACLYRLDPLEYHGQFLVPFSGVAVAMKDQTAPVGPCPDPVDRREGRELSPLCDWIGDGTCPLIGPCP